MTQEQIIKSQSQIESLVLGIVNTNVLECIFSEGVADEGVAHRLRDYVRRATTEIDATLSQPINSYESFSKAFEVFNKHNDNMRNRVVFHNLGPKVGELWKKLTDAVKNNEIVFQNDQEKEMLEITAPLLYFSNMLQTIERFGGQSNP